MEENKTINQDLKLGYSIIVCSYNGNNKVIPTLQHLNELEVLNDVPVEILFVDNNSTDNTAAIAHKTWEELNNKSIDFIIIEEKKAGKYYAINTAIQMARYKFFIICDDDNWLAKDYIKNAHNILEHDPEIGALGGYAEPVFEDNSKELPNWFTENLQMYALTNQGQNGDVTYRKHLWGAGLVSQTALYKNFYAHHPSFLLPTDKTTDMGQLVAEDTEYTIRLILCGYKLYYHNSLRLKHYVPNSRLTKQYFDVLSSRIEASMNYIIPYNAVSKVYGKLAKKGWYKEKLKLSAPIRLVLSKKKNLLKNKTLFELFYVHNSKNDNLTLKIREFVEDKRIIKYHEN